MATAVKQIVCKPLPTTKLTVETSEGEKSYTLVMCGNALKRAEDALGINFSFPKNWKELGAKQLTTLVWAALDWHHSEVTLEEVGQWLAPAQASDLWLMLFEQSFPGLLAKLEQKPAEAVKE